MMTLVIIINDLPESINDTRLLMYPDVVKIYILHNYLNNYMIFEKI